MYPLIESIKVVNGHFQNLAYHNARMNSARRELWNCKDEIDISDFVKIPAKAVNGLYKCTVAYERNVMGSIFQLYVIRKISCLKIVRDNSIDYSYKYANRENLNELLEQKAECDEILIVKNDLVTDTSFSNILFYDGKKWLTPHKPLLKGTKREKLLNEGLIEETEISVSSLKHFEKACLINAMLEIGDTIIDIENIK